MPDINKTFEDELQKIILKSSKKIRKVYEQSIIEIAINTAFISYKGNTFRLSDYPVLNNKISSLIKKMHPGIYSTVINSIEESWNLSNKKNNLIVDKRLAGKKPSKKAGQIFYDPNKEALKQFIIRKEKGLNLSERVWNTLENYKIEMEGALGIGISEGKSASQLASQLKSYLNEPDKLFRRVRDAEEKLKLSKRAREFHPGRGVYRSSYQNALRLTATENNIAYRSSDFERWNNLPFVTGIEVRTSNNHPEYDICDRVKGKYPKEFKFTGWHPRCRCFAVPIQMSDAEYNKYEDSILGIADFDPKSVKTVTEPPAGFAKYVQENYERISNWKSKPYWMTDNKQFVK